MTQFRGRYELSSQGQVKIRSLKLEDSGIYVCKLSSSPDSYSFELVVSGQYLLLLLLFYLFMLLCRLRRIWEDASSIDNRINHHIIHDTMLQK
jgi:hypothetical protein